MLGVIEEATDGVGHGGGGEHYLGGPLGQFDAVLLVRVDRLLLVQHGVQYGPQVGLKSLLQHGVHLIYHNVLHGPEVDVPGVAVLQQPPRCRHHDVHGSALQPLPLLAVVLPAHHELARYLGGVPELLEDRQYLKGKLPRRGQNNSAGTPGTPQPGRLLPG